ncbi:fungal-specific transcription factor domain-containing protein [Cantharellus anzutake]|uniref:fungal-specific transcription factor domain-containing protein n=1 Tax=Cantharellus anzutake TaxID=1750568 RepID=UPI0019040884|nr:fungal-specific transcription factor domain-containing protein [Cantharellus anzutake]KAF8333946.1 fungal-specific transcription factor domain-containing protein [Cantharellus anzutake]
MTPDGSAASSKSPSPFPPTHARSKERIGSTIRRSWKGAGSSQAPRASSSKSSAGDSAMLDPSRHPDAYARPENQFGSAGSSLTPYPPYSNQTLPDGGSYGISAGTPAPSHYPDSHPPPSYPTQLAPPIHDHQSGIQPTHAQSPRSLTQYLHTHDSMRQPSAARTSFMNSAPDSPPSETPEPQIATMYSVGPPVSKKRRRESTTDQLSGDTDLADPELYSPSGSQHLSVSGPRNAGSAKDTPPSSGAATGASGAASKRTKTQRACDSCRGRKIRCDIIPDSNPSQCTHCRSHGNECTFHLPITETRFKRRRNDNIEDDSSRTKDRDANDSVGSKLPSNGPASQQTVQSSHASSSRSKYDAPPVGGVGPNYRPEGKIYGPTSLNYILQTSMPQIHSTSADTSISYQQAWKVIRSGDGFIEVLQDTGPDPYLPRDSERGPEPVERHVLERLVNYYFKNIAPIFPIVTEDEFLHGTGDSASSNYRPSPVLLYAICVMSATARGTPLSVFENLRKILNHIMKTDDVVSNASLSNIQALLIMGMTGEPHGRVVSHAMSAGWLRVSTAIRMAQDLGLHRAEAVKSDIQLRRRLWAACVITDRWYGLTLGLPFMIDVHDCDARLPGPELPTTQSHLTPAEIQQATSLLFMGEFVKLSVLLGKVTRTIYSPTGLIHTTDEVLEHLLAELDRFAENIPPELQYQGRDSNISAGLLHMFYTCVCMMFWRVFARIQYTVPAHLTFSLNVERWSALTRWSGESIDWLDAHEHVYDSWILVAYSIASCALVQYHTWARRKDPDAQACLGRLKDCVQRWDRAVEPGHMPTRRKTAEIISLLYEATQSPVPRNFWPKNPTAGVESRNQEDADALVWKKDPSRPGGGLFIATQRAARALGSDIPTGTLVVPDPQNGEEAEISTELYTNEIVYNHPTMANGGPVDVASLTPPPGDSFVLVTTPLRPVDDASAPQTNVNPGMNSQNEVPRGVQVINMLDQYQHPTTMQSSMQQYAAVNNGLLDGIPATMFEFDQWDSFFQRLHMQADGQTYQTHVGPPNGYPSVDGSLPAVNGYGLQPSQSF